MELPCSRCSALSSKFQFCQLCHTHLCPNCCNKPITFDHQQTQTLASDIPKKINAHTCASRNSLKNDVLRYKRRLAESLQENADLREHLKFCREFPQQAFAEQTDEVANQPNQNAQALVSIEKSDQPTTSTVGTPLRNHSVLQSPSKRVEAHNQTILPVYSISSSESETSDGNLSSDYEQEHIRARITTRLSNGREIEMIDLSQISDDLEDETMPFLRNRQDLVDLFELLSPTIYRRFETVFSHPKFPIKDFNDSFLYLYYDSSMNSQTSSAFTEKFISTSVPLLTFMVSDDNKVTGVLSTLDGPVCVFFLDGSKNSSRYPEFVLRSQKQQNLQTFRDFSFVFSPNRRIFVFSKLAHFSKGIIKNRRMRSLFTNTHSTRVELIRIVSLYYFAADSAKPSLIDNLTQTKTTKEKSQILSENSVSLLSDLFSGSIETNENFFTVLRRLTTEFHSPLEDKNLAILYDSLQHELTEDCYHARICAHKGANFTLVFVQDSICGGFTSRNFTSLSEKKAIPERIDDDNACVFSLRQNTRAVRVPELFKARYITSKPGFGPCFGNECLSVSFVIDNGKCQLSAVSRLKIADRGLLFNQSLFSLLPSYAYMIVDRMVVLGVQ